MKRTIVPRGVLTLSLAVVLVAATVSTASAHRAARASLKPESVGFGNQQVGTTSPVQRFALGVWCRPEHGACPETLNPSIGVSGDYAQTNDCPPTLSVNYPLTRAVCFINVTFTPTGTGPKAGTLSTGPGGPTATLTGNGVTHATPPVLPLLLDVGYQGLPYAERKAALRKKLTLFAETKLRLHGGGQRRRQGDSSTSGGSRSRRRSPRSRSSSRRPMSSARRPPTGSRSRSAR